MGNEAEKAVDFVMNHFIKITGVLILLFAIAVGGLLYTGSLAYEEIKQQQRLEELENNK